MSYFVWAFKKFIRQSSPFALSNALNYRLEKLPKEEGVRLSTLLKELNDVPEELTRAYEDGQLTQEELQKAIQEIAQAQEVLAKKKAYLQWRLEQQKPINIRRRPA